MFIGKTDGKMDSLIRYSSDHVFDYIEIDSQYAILRLKSRRTGLEKMSASWISGKNTVLIFWQQKNMENRCCGVSRAVLDGDATILVLGEYKNDQEMFSNLKREVISVLSVGLLFVTLVGFFVWRRAADRLGNIFTEAERNRKQDKISQKAKTRTGNGRKKDS